MRRRRILCCVVCLISPIGSGFGGFSGAGAGRGPITFQEESDSSPENASPLVGHWRKTTIGYVGPRDEHLVLHPDRTAEDWVVTAESRSEPITGHWSVEGKTLTLSFGDKENSQSFTFYEGQLVFPNVPNRRGFWEKSSSRFQVSGKIAVQ